MIKERVTFRGHIDKGIRSRTDVFYFALSYTPCSDKILENERSFGVYLRKISSLTQKR